MDVVDNMGKTVKCEGVNGGLGGKDFGEELPLTKNSHRSILQSASETKAVPTSPLRAFRPFQNPVFGSAEPAYAFSDRCHVDCFRISDDPLGTSWPRPYPHRATRVSFPPTATLRRLCPIEPDQDNSRR